MLRHAEVISGLDNPSLTPIGEARAEQLADLLEDIDLKAVYSTDFNRTQGTAAPVAARQGLSVTSYEPEGIDAMVAEMLAEGGEYLVVGHGDTVPETIEDLGGPEMDLEPEDEFNRLWVVATNGKVQPFIHLLRYGNPMVNQPQDTGL